jgi:acetolactate synthase-1/2/3 large subunit
VQSAHRLADDVVRAWRVALSGRPGPVHLSVPNDVLDATVESALPRAEHFAAPPEEPDAAKAELIAAALNSAARPLILAGPGAMRKRVDCGIPVIGMESPRGTHDPSLGRLAEVLKKADAVLLLGKRLDFTLKFGQAFADDCRVMESEALPGGLKAGRSEWGGEVRAALAYRPPQWQEIESRNHPVAVCREVQQLLGQPDAILVSDGGEFGQWAQACLSAPRRVINGPAGSIGAALPFAAAAQLAYPRARVVAMLGDGTFGFHMSEIDTAVRYGFNYLAVVGNDATWNAEYQIQLRAYGAARTHSCELLPTRYGAVAAAMGAHGEDVASFGELRPALARAAASGKPACVNVMIERVPAPKY